MWNDTWSLLTKYNVSLTLLQSTYLNTAYQWYLPEKTVDGEYAFLNAIINLTNEFPSNNDAKTLLGLSYLNVGLAERQDVDSNLTESSPLVKARKILKDVLLNEPAHPGSLHYLVHSYDLPNVEAALQGVPYAQRFGEVALTASHGQHMPVHIWTRIGKFKLLLFILSMIIKGLYLYRFMVTCSSSRCHGSRS